MTLGQYAVPFFTTECPHVTRVRDEGKSYAERTRGHARRRLEMYILPDPLCARTLATIRRSDVLDFRARLLKRIGPCRTANVVVRTLGIIFREALYREIIDRDPCSRIGDVVYPAAPRRILDAADVQRLLRSPEWTDRLYWLATATAAMAGLRAGEVRGLKWKALDVRLRRILVDTALAQSSAEEGRPKWGKIRFTIYPRTLQRLLEPSRGEPEEWVFLRRDGSPIGYRWWAAAFRAAAREAGLEGATLHGLRHALHTELRARGIADDPLRGSFGWTGPEVQENYTHRQLYDLSDQVKAVDTVFGGLHGSGPH